ncbi:hypothetical protein [Sabulicella rubraurantiaca]|uniref:hypothetical protein n=1 Tax=Sabulicella rubraurantiaca TaxID=2811429 RepID=UPI001A95FF58|nr:hypothetical protein [Sabulicella rubraurantiaca]
MASLLVATFEDDAGARAGAEILRTLHAEGTVTVYALAVVARGARGAGLVASEPLREGTSPSAPALAVAIAGLISLLGGPMQAAARTLRAGLVSTVRDLEEAGVDAAFLERIERGQLYGGSAVLAEVEHGRQTSLDGRLVACGGRVLWHRLSEAAAEERILRDIAELREDLARLRGDMAEAGPTSLKQEVMRARKQELREATRRALAFAAALRREGAAKVAVLRAQAEALDGDARLAIERRAAAARTALERRAARLEHAAEDASATRPPAGTRRSRRSACG